MEIRALIVDDEKYERLLLSKLINWDKLGIQLAGTAASGDEALRIFQEIHPEIVLTERSSMKVFPSWQKIMSENSLWETRRNRQRKSFCNTGEM